MCPTKKTPKRITQRELKRCFWAGTDELYRHYHDNEWGVPVHDERRLFEMLILEGAQAGLNRLTILKKREGYRAAFDGFDPAIVARYRQAKVERLLQNSAIVRNRLKIESAIKNASAFLVIQKEFGSAEAFLWQFVGGRPKANDWSSQKHAPVSSPESDAMSAALKARGCTFVGSIICYAFMQAVGMVNDHTIDCFRFRECARLR